MSISDLAARQLHFHRTLLQGRICWVIALVVFGTILIVEAAILIPSYRGYEREREREIANLASRVVETLLATLPPGLQGVEPVAAAGARVARNSAVLAGGAVYAPAGGLLAVFGEEPRMAPPAFASHGRQFIRSGDAVEVLVAGEAAGLEFMFIGRADASSIAPALQAFFWRITGLVALIASVVTLTTMIFLGLYLLWPVLRLRNSLIAAGNNPDFPASYLIDSGRPDELGDVARAFNNMLRLNASYMHEQDKAKTHLEERVRQRTAELETSNASLAAEIAERERAEALLKENQKRLEDFGRASSDWFWEMDAELRFTWLSKEVEKVTGVPRQWHYGKTREEIGVPDVNPDAWQAHLGALAERKPFRDFEYRRQGPDGTHWLRASGVPVFDAQGQFKGYRGTGSDITEIYQSRDQVAQAQQRFNNAIETFSGGFALFDADDRLVACNQRYRRYIDNPTLALGCKFEDLLQEQMSKGKIFEAAGREKAWIAERLVRFRKPRGAFDVQHIEGRWLQIQEERMPDGSLLLSMLDITDRKKAEQRLAHQAAHDDLTGLLNRREFEARLEKSLADCRERDAEHALCYLDLDQFKIINDTVGHMAGDELLKQLGGLLKSKVRRCDTLARLGGDEFGLLLGDCSLDQACVVANSLIAELARFRFVWGTRHFNVGVSIGLVSIKAGAEDSGQLLTQADIACYTAKELGRSRIHIYRADDAESAKRHDELLHVAHFREALDQNRFRLYRQPIESLSAASGGGQHFEILLRLEDFQGNIISAGAFIPAAERFQLMGAIDRWVIHAVLSDCDSVLRKTQPAIIAINLSGNSLSDDSLLGFVREEFSRSVIKPECICFEITETAAVSNLKPATRFITEMKKLGCRFALDDFGSGLSSFTYLKDFPVDYLKIDGSFVRDMINNSTDRAVVSAINHIGHAMGIETIAEFVESDAIIEALRALKVDYVQGYAVGRPEPLVVPADEQSNAA